MKRIVTLITVLALLLGICLPAYAAPASEAAAETPAVKAASALPAYKDESYSYAERALDLVSRMTLEEKASQTAGYNAPAIPRLGIAGYMWWNEALHGYSQEGWFGAQTDGASYPSSYSMGASWDPEIYYREGVQIGAEIRERVKENRYNLTMFSPTVNLGRDPRWGRNDESYGEDPLIVGLLGASFVNGVEGKNIDGSYIRKNANGEGVKQAVTTIKHYSANNTEKNRYTSGADNVTVREMREYYTRPARIVVKNADVSSVMMAYSSVSGIPISYSSYYMDTVLRQSYGFSGYIVSDCDSVATSFNRNVHKNNPHTGENYNQGEAFANAMANGLDLQCNAGETDGLGSYASNHLKMMYEADGSPVITDKGFFTEQQLEVTVARLMTKRMQLGEFDADNFYATEGKARLDAGKESNYVNGVIGQTQERIDLADDLSRSTIVLLKNEGSTLPITASEINAADGYDVAIIGPVGQSNFRGGYSSRSSNEANLVTIEQAIKTAFADSSYYPQAAVDNVNIAYHYGYSSAVNRSRFTGLRSEDIAIDDVAEGLDLAIVVVGQGSGDSREDGDRTDLHLAQAQIDLIKAVKAKNPRKLVLIMETYGPVQMSDDIVGNADAILWSGFNGFRKGTGFGEAITGKNNPNGRTNATWLKDMINDIPGFFDYSLFPANGHGGRTYMYNVEETIYPFGFGLSYSDVVFSASGSILGAQDGGRLTLGTADKPITKDSTIDVKFQIRNRNGVAGKQVAEVYVVSPGAGTNNYPLKRLVGFKKVDVGANATVDVTIPLKVTDFGFFNEEKDCYELPAGDWKIYVSKSSEFNLESDLVESFTVQNGAIREDPVLITVKPTQPGDEQMNINERVIFHMSKDAARNVIDLGVAVTMANEKLYGTRVINNVPGVDIGVNAAAATAAGGDFANPDTAADLPRLEAGKSADQLPHVGTKFVLPEDYKVEYTSNRPAVIKVEDGKLVMAGPGVATVTVKVTGPSGVSASADVALAVMAAPGLANMTIGGEGFQFDPTVNSVNVGVPAGIEPDDEYLTVVANPVEGGKVEYSLTGEDGSFKAADKGINPDAFPCTVYIKATSADGVEQLYFVKYVRQFSGSSFVSGEIDSEWTIVNEDKDSYEVIPGLGLKLNMQPSAISASNDNWKNLFTRPIAGDWTAITKLYFPEGFNTGGQQFQVLMFERPNNMVAATLQVANNGRSITFNMAPTVDGQRNGSISHTTNLAVEEGPRTIYLKLQHKEMGLTIWYSADGKEWTQVQSADGRRRGESSFMFNPVLGLYAAGGANNTDKSVIIEYIDVIEQNGEVFKDEDGVYSDAFKNVARYVHSAIPEVIESDLDITIPADYALTYDATDCIAADGTVTRPAQDKDVQLVVKLSHPTAKINGKNPYTVFNGTVKVKGTGAATGDYAVNAAGVKVGVNGSAALPVIFDAAKVMSAAIDVADASVASAEPARVTEAGSFTLKGLKSGETTAKITFYGLPNNVELGNVTVPVTVSADMPAPLDDSALKAAIDKAKALPDKSYTFGTAAALAFALDDAEQLSAYSGDQADYDAAAKALEDAIAGLIEEFEDVSEPARYYYEPVYWALDKGITTGTSTTRFSPNEGATRAQVVTFLWRAAGEPKPETKETPFEDVTEGRYYYDAVLWAVEKEITKGTTPTTFRPDQTCTRGQIVAFLYRYYGEPELEDVENPFEDVAETAYYHDAVLWAVENGITNGTTPTTFRPDQTCTRAQIVTFLYRADQNIKVETPAESAS